MRQLQTLQAETLQLRGSRDFRRGHGRVQCPLCIVALAKWSDVGHPLRMSKTRQIDEGFAKAGVASAERHVFLCGGPDCCDDEEGAAVWDVLKRRIKKLGLPVMRTKAGCFRVCHGGPWLVVYPDGVWYGGVTPARMERIVDEHFVKGKPVTEWVARVQPLQAKPP